MAASFIAGIEGDPLVYLNGELTPLSEAKISVLDRGFIFGDGVYEVVPVYRKKPFRMEQHLARLFRSLAAIRIDNPFRKEEWVALVERLIGTSEREDQFVYLQVTRGVAKRDHAFPTGIRPTVFGMTSPFTRPTQEQRTRGVEAVTMKDERWLHCEIKSVSLLGNVLAKQYAVDHGAAEVVMFRDGFLTEGSASNLWVGKGGTLYAPPRSNLILEGIRYGFIEELCREIGVRLEVRPVPEAEVRAADELMMSSATKEVLPITTLDKKPVGTGQPGAIYAKLRAAYDRAVAG